MEEAPNDVNKRKISLKLILTVLGVLLVIALGSSGYFFYKFKDATADPSKKAEKELADVKIMISKHLLLPEDEEPTLATVSDPEKLTEQPFFKNAEKGDKVLLYARSKKAILYSVKKDQILEVAPFSGSGEPTN